MPQLIESGVAYLALKAAQKLYSKATAALQPEEFERVQGLAQQQYSLETRVLAASEARAVMVPPATVEAAMQEIRGRYQSEEGSPATWRAMVWTRPAWPPRWSAR